MPEDSKLIPFGKYAGQPIEVLRNDPSYVQWLMGKDWFRNRFTAIHTLIVNNFGEPTETPEHNTLQAQFLDDGFCRKLLAKLEWPPVTEGARFVRERRDEHWQKKLAKAEAALSELQEPSELESYYFEVAERFAGPEGASDASSLRRWGVHHPPLGCLLTEAGSGTFGTFRGFAMRVVSVRAFVNERLSHLRLRARRG